MTDVTLLTDRSAADEPVTVIALGLRAVWLHLALTGARAAALTSRDRDVLAFVATSVCGVSAEAVAAHLRRGGVKWPSAIACVQRLLTEGYLSRRLTGSAAFLVDLPQDDLAWITQTTTRVIAAVRPDRL